MSAKVDVRHAGPVAIVDIAGRVTLGEGAGLLHTAVRNLVAEGHKHILLNLKNATYIDSAGLGEMVGSYATVTNQGGQIKLVNVQNKISDLLQITKLYTVFPAFNNEDEAVRSFGAVAGA